MASPYIYIYIYIYIFFFFEAKRPRGDVPVITLGSILETQPPRQGKRLGF